jgi:hypothetical protein
MTERALGHSTQRRRAPYACTEILYKCQVLCEYRGVISWRDLTIGAGPLIYPSIDEIEAKLALVPQHLPHRIVQVLQHEIHPR